MIEKVRRFNLKGLRQYCNLDIQPISYVYVMSLYVHIHRSTYSTGYIYIR